MKLNIKYLLSPIFIVSLGLLLLNDFYLKETFHNELTGKLSDFSGIIVLGLFLNFLTDKRKLVNVLITGLFFLYWKSPLADNLISSFNEFGFYQIGRVVDYWDLTALIMLPFISKMRYKERPFQGANLAVTSLSIITIFALSSTSRYPRNLYWESTDVVYEFTSNLSPGEFVSSIYKNEHLRLVRQDSITINYGKVNSFLFVHDTLQSHILDSCRLTLIAKNDRKLQVQVISVGIGPTANLNKLDLVELLKRYEISGKIESRKLFIQWDDEK